MIYYFSGTGNSKWAAEELARLTGDEARAIPQLLESGEAERITATGPRVGIVFPVYAWGPPTLVECFCKKLAAHPGEYRFAVCTCGDDAGNAMKRLKRFFDWESAWSLAMPNNYIIGFDVDSSDLETKKIASACSRLAHIAESIMMNTHEYDVHAGIASGLKTALIRPMFNKFARRTKPFHVTDECNGCGLCARICPVKAIRMENGVLRWVKKSCAQCMGCINRCPQRAIQYGVLTASKGRYFFHENINALL